MRDDTYVAEWSLDMDLGTGSSASAGDIRAPAPDADILSAVLDADEEANLVPSLPGPSPRREDMGERAHRRSAGEISEGDVSVREAIDIVTPMASSK